TATYTLAQADIGATIRVQVTATNPVGSASATSAPSAVVTPAPPVNTAADGVWDAVPGTAAVRLPRDVDQLRCDLVWLAVAELPEPGELREHPGRDQLDLHAGRRR